MSIEIREPLVVRSLDLREMTFQNVVDNILRPSGIKIGGFPEELFLSLTEQEQRDMMCNICFLIANDCRLCDNDHVFCHSCTIAWSMTFGENALKCPACRCDQPEYNESEELQKRIASKQVRCQEEGCGFQSTLAEYLLHGHGKDAYSNAHVDFSCLRLRSQLLRPPSAENGSPTVLSASIRSQLLQSRTMIQQMMMLMRIEMQLRQQALFNFQQSPNPDAERAPRLDDALALNSQLSEISSVLSMLIRSTSGGQRLGRRWPAHRDLSGPQRLRRADASGFTRSAALRRLSNSSTRQWREIDTFTNDDASATDDDDSDDDEDDVLDINNESGNHFIWQQLNDIDTDGTSVDTIRSSPDGMSDISSAPDVQSLSGFQSIPSVISVSSNQSLSSMSNVCSSVSSVLPSISYEGRQVTPTYLLPVNNCQLPTAEGQHSCQFWGAPDNVTVTDDDEADRLILGSSPDLYLNPSLARDATLEPRPQQVDVLNPSSHGECGAAVFGAPLSESVNTYQSCQTYSALGVSGVESAGAAPRILQPIVRQGRGFSTSQTLLPPVGRELGQETVVANSSLLRPPGTCIPPYLNYAARLRRQASEMPHLPSEVSIRPWPFPGTDHALRDHLPTSPATSGSASRRAGLSSRLSAHQLPTYQLPSRQSSTLAAPLQRGSTHRGRGTRHSHHNTSRTGDQTRIPRQ